MSGSSHRKRDTRRTPRSTKSTSTDATKSSRRTGERSDVPRAAKQAEQQRDGTKDDARTLALLWRPHQKAGRSGLALGAILECATKMADEEGLAAVSMRRLGEVLGVGTMSLYTHVPGKAELTDLMVDGVHGELYSDVEEARNQPGGHRERLRFIADRNRVMYVRHPWLLEVPLGRPVLGPNAARNYEADLRALDGIGLTAIDMDSIRALLVLHVQSSARLQAANLSAQRSDGMTEEEWWTTTVPLLRRVMVGSFPVAGRVGKAAGEALAPGPSHDHLYRFGLDVLCDAVDTLIARNRGS
jgi:AcrR family transcriptional regulator